MFGNNVFNPSLWLYVDTRKHCVYILTELQLTYWNTSVCLIALYVLIFIEEIKRSIKLKIFFIYKKINLFIYFVIYFFTVYSLYNLINIYTRNK